MHNDFITLGTVFNVCLHSQSYVNISSDLKWNVHVSELVRKVSPRLHFLRQLKRGSKRGFFVNHECLVLIAVNHERKNIKL